MTIERYIYLKKINILKSLLSILSTVLLAVNTVSAQELNQTVRGKVHDETVNSPLPGATVQILTTDPIKGDATDQEGSFRIKNVPVGRHDVKISFVGYEPRIIRNIMVSSGKEVILNIGLTKSAIKGKEVVITPDQHGIEAINTMAPVSARKFSAEETRRYAGGLDDPSRLASGFAGVSTNTVFENALVVRGNSPKGLSWQLEGVAIPNPNHLAGANIAGGGSITIFSNTLLADSDFMTGAFPAEYGNALAGIFDINFKNGNNQSREYTLEVGTTGLNAGAEGPFTKDGNSSYLFNYRYSTIALALKLLTDDNIGTEYQDLSFKLNFPTKKAGTFSLWGIGGLGFTGREAETDSTEWEYNIHRQQDEHQFLTGAGGLNHKLSVGEQSLLNSTLSATISGYDLETDSLDNAMNFIRQEEISNKDVKLTFQSELTHRFNASHTNKTGVIANQLFYDVTADLHNQEQGQLEQYIDEQGNTTHLQGYTQSKVSFSDRLSATAGIHFQYFDLNKNYSIEPRIGFNWTPSSSQSIGLAYGLHSQLAPTKIYFTNYDDPDGGQLKSNKDLDFTKAHHLVLSYKHQLSDNLWLWLEPYVQQLYNVQVVPNSHISFINYNQVWFFDDPLVNEGEGRNIGIDITLERSFSNNYYFLFTTSLFDATYETAEGVRHNSRYNRNYVVNLLGGKEFILGDDRNRLLGLNARVTLNGGARTTPILREESKEQEQPVFDWTRPFENQRSASFIADLSVTYRINKSGYTSEWALQVKNMFATPSFDEYKYNYKYNRVEPFEVSVIIPSVSYRIEF